MIALQTHPGNRVHLMLVSPFIVETGGFVFVFVFVFVFLSYLYLCSYTYLYLYLMLVSPFIVETGDKLSTPSLKNRESLYLWKRKSGVFMFYIFLEVQGSFLLPGIFLDHFYSQEW